MTEKQKEPVYHSKFGGLWIDRSDFRNELQIRLEAGEITNQEADDLQLYEKNGYIIFRGAVDPDLCGDYLAKFNRIWEDPPPTLWVSEGGKTVRFDVAQIDRIVKAGDFHYYYNKAAQIVFPDRVLRFLQLIYQRPPVIFQSMTCRKGTQEPLHTDTGPLALSEPMGLAASWLALEDVVEGAGELQYLPGSHRVPEQLVNGKTKAHHGDMAGYHKVLQAVQEECRIRDYQVETFMAKKGDVLIWSADLLHGGKPIVDQSLTRQSLICHFMPHGAMPTFYNSAGVKYVDYGNGGYCLDRFDPAEVAYYNNPERVPGSKQGYSTARSSLHKVKRFLGRLGK